ncbi:MAG: DUF4392 domain-containing protein [Aminivibrio sp.]|jgi:hypothetical protein
MDAPAAIGRLIASDRGDRKVSSLFQPVFLSEALALVDNCSRAAVVSGFYVPSRGAPETDGPGGAVVFARALALTGREVAIFTDSYCGRALRACCDAVGGPGVIEVESGDEVLAFRPDLLVFIERLGRAEDGRYYNMRREDISAFTPPLDSAALGDGVRVLAVGDGGNEAGMGVFRPSLSKLLPDFAGCLSVIGADLALPVDVSDWGGYALATMLSIASGRWLGPEGEEIEAMLEALVAVGAVDGVTLRSEATVDGFSAEEHALVARGLKELWSSA